MIVFATCVGYPEKLEKHAAPGLEYSMGDEPYKHWRLPSNGRDIFPVYGAAMRRGNGQKRMEALVLMHDDLEFCDRELAAKIRLLMSDPSIAIVGCIGSRGATSLAWWAGERFGRVEDTAYGVHDFGFDGGDACDVDTMDGMFLVLSPWALENLTLEGLGYEGFHGYADELCAQARAKGKRAVVAPIDAFHHSKGGITGDPAAWQRAEENFAKRWRMTKPNPWAMLKQPPETWDLAAMYDAHRGAPVSPTPLVNMVVPSYRETYDIVTRTEPSRLAVIDDLLEHGIDVIRSTIEGDSLVQRMRQRAVHQFLKSPATHLLWCDLDIEARDPACVRKMLASGFDVVAGACPFKSTDRKVVCNLWPADAAAMTDGLELALPHGCLEVQDAGTGFMLVSRTALLRLMQAHPELVHTSMSASDRDEPLWALYDTGVADGVYQSEDFMFCRHWQQLGGKVYVHVPSTFRHYGTHGFEASLMEQLGFEPTP